jgi:ATP-dependent Clp protease ATP-binding subunit ClpX
MLSVFNHYNRVRANFATAIADEQDMEWRVRENSEWVTSSAVAIIIELQAAYYSGVSAAHLHPHPRRMNPPHMPLQSRHPVPLFEKSNVLVMCVFLHRHILVPHSPR